MTPPRRSRRRPLPTLTALAVLALAGCSQGGLDPHGSEAERILDVLVALLVGATVVSVLVLALWGWGTWRRTRDEDVEAHRLEDVPDSRRGRWLVLGGGLVMPAVLMAAYFGVQVASTMAQPAADGDGPTIEVVGHRYWWEVTYHGLDGLDPFETANEIHVPTGTDVTVVLRSTDVIHSFWVPELAGKVDMVPGRENRFVLSADDPGRYAGYCAEYCGLQHTWMKFDVVASPPDEFAAWAAAHAVPADEPETALQARGREVFLGQSCVGCHTIRGVAEGAELGPDLTHLATRDEIGAGIRPLTADDLHAWVANAQAIKPGAQMPPQELTPDELDALVAYLMSLE